jgi:TonB family protein
MTTGFPIDDPGKNRLPAPVVNSGRMNRFGIIAHSIGNPHGELSMTRHCISIALGVLLLALTTPPALAQDDSMDALCADGDRDVEIVTRTPPLWPMAASLLCVEGDLRVAFTVDTAGRTKDIRVNESSAPGVFDRAAIDALADWQFVPRCKGGQAVERKAVQRIEFKLPADQAGDCPETIPDELFELTISIAAIYSAFADALLESEGGPVELIDLQPAHDGDFGLIEQLHIRAVNNQAQVVNSEDQRQLLESTRRLMNFSRLAADEDFSETRRLADAHADALERAYSNDQRLQRELRTAARAVREEVRMSDESWEFLVGRFIRTDPGDTETLQTARRYLDEMMTLLRLLHERRDGWQPDPGNSYAQVFSDSELEQLANELKASINQTIENATTPQMEWLLSWSRL